MLREKIDGFILLNYKELVSRQWIDDNNKRLPRKR